jgi:hypothetical protein
MDVSRCQATNVEDAYSDTMRAPANQFAHFRTFPAGDARDVVRFNFDTLYSMAWLDLRDGPVVLHVPDSPDRYYLTPMLDMWSDVFAVPGTRTTEGASGDFVLAQDGWQGVQPSGARLVHTTTPFVWIIGRTQTNGPSDYERVHAIQDQYRITPLSRLGEDYQPPASVPTDPSVDDLTSPQEQVWGMSGTEFFSRFAEFLTVNPPHANDYPILFRIENLGLVPGQPFTPTDDVLAVLDQGVAAAKADMISAITDGTLGSEHNGWQWMQSGAGAWGTNYRQRAMVAYAGLGCNLPEDALYPNRATDSDGVQLTGTNTYVLRFERDALPPAQAFWSLTMYDHVGFQVPNPIDRFAIGDRDNLTFGDDGTLELLIQHKSPGTAWESNWLPAPAGEFELTLRIYSPKAEVFRTGLSLPAPRRV